MKSRAPHYTRKSTEEGLEQEFNSLDAQRESAEAYIASQQHEGWTYVPEHYDDGGFTGGNMDRPALKRLMADIEAGKVNCVVVYKVDRLSRSLLDFAKMMETFDRYQVSFVSVTQQFNTATSMGRLILNVLLSFAQFEREMISERTRDKIAAARRKGKWSGGMPLLGYDVRDTKLIVNAVEAERVRQIFGLYLERLSLLGTVKELNRRGWTTKQWTTRKGTKRGGRAFNKNRLYALLTNPTYIGQVKYKDETHDGEHEAIVDEDLFRRVQTALERNGGTGGRSVRNKYGALLRGLLRCAACDCAMTHAYTAKGNRRYRYYVCTNAQQRGWEVCPSPSVPAGEIERFVVDQIKVIGRDPAVIASTVREVRRQADEQRAALQRERGVLVAQIRSDTDEERCVSGSAKNGNRVVRLADLQERLHLANQRRDEIDAELQALSDDDQLDEHVVTQALANFDNVWSELSSFEKIRVLELLVEHIVLHGERNIVSLTFRPSGIHAFAKERSK